MGYVPVDLSAKGTKLFVNLPDEYSTNIGEQVDAEVVEMPFRPSVNPNAREIAKSEGRDATF